MANGRLYSAYKGAGKAKSSYKASLYDIQNIGLESQHSAAMDSLKGKRREDAIGLISESLTAASNLYEGHKSKEQMSKISKEMGAEVQKQSGLDWLFGSEKEYTYKDKTYTASELKTKYQSDDFKDVLKTESTKVDKTGVGIGKKKPKESWLDKNFSAKDDSKTKTDTQPTLAEEAGMSKQAKKPSWLSDDKGMIQGYTEDGKKKLRFGEEKGIDTKTKDWFSNLFKGGADQGFTGDNSTRLDAPFNPEEHPQGIGIVKTKSNYNPLDDLSKEDLDSWMSSYGDKSSDKKPLTQYANWIGGN